MRDRGGRHRRAKGPGGPARPSRSGRVTAPPAADGVAFTGPAPERLLGPLLSMLRATAPPEAPGRAVGIEVWADRLAETVYAEGAMPRDFYAELGGGLAASEDVDAPAALAALAVALAHRDAEPLRAVHRDQVRARRGTADEDTDQGIGRAVPVRAREIVALNGDGVTVVVDVDQPTAPHSVSVHVDHNLMGVATDAGAGPPWTDGHSDDEGTVVAEVSLADARARIRHALDMAGHSPGAPGAAEMDSVRALVERRLALLPSGGGVPARPTVTEEEMDDHVQAFLASPEAGALDDLDRAEAGWIAELWIDHAVNDTIGGPLRVSPTLVELFGIASLPHSGGVDEATLAAAPAVLDAWIRYAARVTDVDDRGRDEALAALATITPHLASPRRATPLDRALGGLPPDTPHP
ncbi:MAG TPA: hypothetical protein VEW93_01670 [Acidimicrobiales bacterium]|nr:hypothetical protein [Acidimicrobiales bacterium]